MSGPNLTWVFTAKSNITGYEHHPQLSAPVDADLSALIEELKASGYEDPTLVRKEWESWAWPGGYPLFYLCSDSGILCPSCVNENIDLTSDPDCARDWRIDDVDINYEDDALYCDHCGKHIESGYGETECDDTNDGEALASAGHGTDEDYNPGETI